ncbi:N-acetylmuramoyl-L-alanine amidase [Lacticaseibacillus daqingensis]|uniref:N-acetylmuramoyl-L-alanine amidase n=1 Tax=Lacticaseibacillus daqingensis TaxID=2486014 RepID=UPI000F775E80|nr:N-acetylmuramoyl-L-alanine amidase [Lacticaseibacillus daqingensis]
MTFSKLTTYVDTRPMNGSPANSATYPRHKIDRIVIHHNSGTNYKGALDTWLVGGPANTSAHYEITPTMIIGCVEEERSAWHAGNKLMNQRSIGLEHVNSAGAPGWPVAEETLKNSAKLCADLCDRYDIPIDATHIVPHNSVVPTDCPGGINMSHYIDLVRQAAGQPATTPTPTPAPSGKTITQLAAEVIAGKYGSGDARKAALGSQYAAVQAEVNRQLGGTASAPKPAPAPSNWHAQTGSFTITTSPGIKLRSGSASTSASLLAVLPKGSVVKYDAYGYFDGYVWIRQPRSGGYGYLPTGTASGTKRTSYWGSFK